jgi:eukaryotic-like serine/threonine-protein kinase
MRNGANHLYEFGPYRLDPTRNLLFLGSQPVPLTSKAFETLLLLVEHSDQDVSKEELMTKLWPDTFVEEANLVQHISMVRKALGETPQDRRYIITLPGRGYRFAEKVRTVSRDGTDPPGNGTPPSAAIEQRNELPKPEILPLRHVRRRHLLAIFGSVTVVALLAVSLFILHRHKSIALRETDTIVIADFANSTGDPVFDDTLKTALNVSLRQSPFLNVLPDSEVAKNLRLMTLPANTKITTEVASQLCQRAGSKAYVAGAIANLGSEYVLGLKAMNCQNGDTLVEEQSTVASKEKVLAELGKEATKLRQALGESLATVQRFDVPLAEATTPSLDALKAFSTGRKIFREKGVDASLPYMQHAIELDSNFAMAYMAVGFEYGSLGEVERAKEYFTKAFESREHASEREKMAIAASYYTYATGEVDKAIQAYQRAIESYPRDGALYLNLSVNYAAQGHYEKAAETARQGMRTGPDQRRYRECLSTDALALQHFDEVRQISRDAESRKWDDDGVHGNLYGLAFIQGDSNAMAEQQRWFASKQEYESYGLELASATEAYAGHLIKARELAKHAIDSARGVDNKESAAIWQANEALTEAAYGNQAEARRLATEALKLAPSSQGAESETALALAMTNDTVKADSLAKDLAKRFPLDTQMQSLWLPAVQAQLALNGKNPADALNDLQSASAIEFGNIPFGNNISCLYHVYLRGQSYLAAGQGKSAAPEFQKILDNNSIVWNCWTGALAHLGVARANALEFKTLTGAEADAARARALAAYKDFLTLWKDADSDIPILKEAKIEYSKLQQLPSKL